MIKTAGIFHLFERSYLQGVIEVQVVAQGGHRSLYLVFETAGLGVRPES